MVLLQWYIVNCQTEYYGSAESIVDLSFSELLFQNSRANLPEKNSSIKGNIFAFVGFVKLAYDVIRERSEISTTLSVSFESLTVGVDVYRYHHDANVDRLIRLLR